MGVISEEMLNEFYEIISKCFAIKYNESRTVYVSYENGVFLTSLENSL
jgi:hypothetical protein